MMPVRISRVKESSVAYRERRMKKVLIGLDGSRGAMKAVEYVGDLLKNVNDLHITLFNVLPGLPPEFWDDGHIMSEQERAERKAVVLKWKANAKLKLGPIFEPAMEVLIRRGIRPQQIETRYVHESIDLADEILMEARAGHYYTLVLGRCGRSSATHMLLGSIASKIINRGAGMAITIVE